MTRTSWFLQGLYIDLRNADALASSSARDPPKQESCTGFQKYVTKGTRSIRRCTHYTTQSYCYTLIMLISVSGPDECNETKSVVTSIVTIEI